MALNIEIAQLSFSYGPAQHRLSGVNLEVAEGEICCLLGPNGAGKTTLIRCIIGLLRPDHGTLRVAGHNAFDLRPRQLARLVAYVPQTTTTVFPFTALDVAVMGRTPHLRITDMPSPADHHAARDVLDSLGIGDLARRPFAQLSGGERQLVMIARALIQEAPVLVLDEPTASLDYGNEVRILQVVKALASNGRSVLMTTHQPNHALWWASRTVLMNEGSVVASGPPRDVITADRLSDLYQISIQIGELPMPEGRTQLTCVPNLTQARPTENDAGKPAIPHAP